MFLQRRFDCTFGVAPVAADQRQIDFFHASFTQLLVQRHQRRAFFGEHQHARGIAIEPMHQLQEFCVRPHRAQLFNGAQADSAAAMHGESRRFVDNQHRRVLVQNVEFDAGARLGQLRRIAFRDTNGRDAHPVAVLNPVVRPNAALVDPHLAAAQNAVNVALRHPFKPSYQVVVDALPGFFGADFQPVYSFFT